MDYNAIQVFVQAYEVRSLTKVAERGFISRQALSRTLANLEDELGPLFVREARGIRPLPLADAIYPHARIALEARDRMVELARLEARAASKVLRVTYETGAVITLPRGLTDAFSAAHPGTKLQTTTLPTGSAVEALHRGDADVVVTTPPADPSLRFQEVLREGLRVIFKADALKDAGQPVGKAAGGALVYGPGALRGQKVYALARDNYIERKTRAYLAARSIDVDLSYDRGDIALARDEMESGLGGIFVDDVDSEEKFGSPAFAHVAFDGEDAPDWRVGTLSAPDSPLHGLIDEFAAFTAGFVRAHR